MVRLRVHHMAVRQICDLNLLVCVRLAVSVYEVPVVVLVPSDRLNVAIYDDRHVTLLTSNSKTKKKKFRPGMDSSEMREVRSKKSMWEVTPPPPPSCRHVSSNQRHIWSVLPAVRHGCHSHLIPLSIRCGCCCRCLVFAV